MFISRIEVSKISLILLCSHLLIQQSGVVQGRASDSSEDEEYDDWNFPSIPDEPKDSPPPLPAPILPRFSPSNQSQPSSISGNHSHGNSAHNISNNARAITNHSLIHGNVTPPVSKVNLSSSGAAQHFANYNESCGLEESSTRCDPMKELICSTETSKCVCDASNNFVFAKLIEKCLKVSARSTDFSCLRDEQCHESTYGPYSSCDPGTGRCSCLEKVGNSEIIQHNDKCFIRKQVGVYCKADEECEASISGKSICIYKPRENTGDIGLDVLPINATKQCLCDDGFIFDNSTNGDLRECLPRAKDESSSCKSDVQCTSGLGPVSRCAHQSCECADVVSWKGEAVYYKGKCYIRLGLGDTCETDTQCKAGIHENAVCANQESFLEGANVCVCPDGMSCEGSGAGSILISMNLFLIGFTATLIAA